ncbi:HNH endonuclease [Acinetobacter johnsonii]|nr:HNH endonuclease [Acinetobacter johnsonii]UIP95263.1 HNH endonuclease [Acinetobacter johnsonii]
MPHPADTGHNFVLANCKSNLEESNYLAYKQFLNQWLGWNHLHDRLITQEISQLGFLTDMQRSHRVADWAYRQAVENEYLVWLGGSEKKLVSKLIEIRCDNKVII